METFRRFEKKYLLNASQYMEVMRKIEPYVKPDKFFAADISSIYYDTDKYELIRRSIEKPEYKEKLRIRSYKDCDETDKVFVEFKKKLDGIVYKRRTKAICKEVLEDIAHCSFKDEQVGNEIRYALSYYGKLKPKIYIGCTRTSYVARDDENLRITFDRDIRYRTKDLSLRKSRNDKSVTEDTVMELKVKDAMPLWLTKILDECEAYPRGFSKVGTAFLNALKGE
ncbi:MAG: polyphosphate polymerase domain-containing protein [Erysipelotrichaceae bacterium]|nr:polyphosphate polymerase domain-containing protein [Erysipelotrichaceae bacterium]